MSSGQNLQEMEVGNVQQSKTAANANAKPGDPMPSMSGTTPGQTASYEDLGGPTPENYKTDDDSAKLKTPGATLKQVKDVVNAKAKPAMAAPAEEVEVEEPVIEEETTDEVVDEVVAEEETTTEEVVAEQETAEEEVVAEYNVEEDVNALLGGEELSEDFKEKAKTIFEAAINSKVSTIKVELEEAYAAKLAEEVEAAKKSLAERVDSYLEYVADEWVAENALAIETGLKTEMTESFLSGMKGLFEEHYVTIPEEKYDVLESMVEKLDDMETKLNEQIEKNISLNSRLNESVAEGILDEISEGLASTQKEKLASLSESVEFESEKSYREKLETLKESYFPKSAPVAKTETLSEGETHNHQQYSDKMSAYLRSLGTFSKS